MSKNPSRSTRCPIIPPYLIARLAEHPDPQVAASARATLDEGRGLPGR